MKLTNKDIIYCNDQIRRRNKQARYNSIEEKKFTMAGTGGMFLMWQPYSNSTNEQIGLPQEIGQTIGEYLDWKKRTNIAQVCQNAHQSAIYPKEEYITRHGKSYEEESYVSLLFF
ncbi:Uncharacterised protein [Legionella beliardensis]|uniref:Uncharacterized protein n=1 Tax=Legionella beliardensis TaxID=91822 RepID=A0A378I127_9GAMM|nr:hypothetical protein [Legionella beliardensis]STX28888.1 Uncharacterised protein [Legionella beliardensis]